MHARMRHRMWRLPLLRRRWCILMILGRRARWISIFPRMPLNLLARRRRRALVLLGRGLRNRKTIARAWMGLGERKEQTTAKATAFWLRGGFASHPSKSARRMRKRGVYG